MRNLINLITEASVPTKTRTGDLTLNPDMRVPVGHVADRHDLTVTAPHVPAEMHHDLANLSMQDDISDDDAWENAGYDDSDAEMAPTIDNLPALVFSEIVHSGENFDPKWTQIKHLPGYMKNTIRALGRQVFARFTTTPIEDVQMMSSLTNPEDDVKKMVMWITQHGHKEDEMMFDFSETIRGYSAQVQIWRAGGFQFCLCKDMAGHYIYAWPEGHQEVVHHDDVTAELPDAYADIRRLN